MRTVCGWCGCEMGEVPDERPGGGGVSHGICESCAAFFENNRGVGIREFVEGLKAPVLIVDGDIRVELANGAARHWVDLKLVELEGLLVGDVLECAQARMPGGCGGAHICVLGCALRRCILETLATGRPMEGIEARQEVLTGKGLREMRLWFSTARADGRVLLRIDHAETVTPGHESFAEGSSATRADVR